MKSTSAYPRPSPQQSAPATRSTGRATALCRKFRRSTLAIFLWSAFTVQALAAEPGESPAANPLLKPEHPGRKQAEITCSACHLVPDPGLLTRPIWKDIVLKKMSFYTGVNQLDTEKNEEGDLYKASGLFPSTPSVSPEGWKQIESYYLESSPPERLPQGARPEISVGLTRFELDPPRFRMNPPLTTMVFIDAAERLVFAADAGDQSLHVLDSTGREVGKAPVGNIPVWARKTERGLYLACIGHFFPKEERRGQLIVFEKSAEGLHRRVLLSRLARPCFLEFADLNADAKPDLLISSFGYLTGRFAWYEDVDAADSSREHLVFGKAGPLATAVWDFDGDGAPDIALLTGQETETLQILFNDGRGDFARREKVFQRPPSYGHTYFELADFNRDGQPDLLVCNGDNGDYESPAKPYHGIRILLNRGHAKFEEAAFIPIHGVFKAVARDFDEDGDLDIAAISFYPDYERSPRESFVYLENEGGLRFKASTFKECVSGRWLVMDAGDLDGDGDIDLVLGSMIRMPAVVPDFVKSAWEASGPSVVILRNTLRAPTPASAPASPLSP